MTRARFMLSAFAGSTLAALCLAMPAAADGPSAPAAAPTVALTPTEARIVAWVEASRPGEITRAAQRCSSSRVPKRCPQWKTSASPASRPNHDTTISGTGSMMPCSVSAAAATSRMSSLIGAPMPQPKSSANSSA